MKLIRPILPAVIFIILYSMGCSQQNSKPCGNITFKYFDVVLNDLKTNGTQSIYFDSLSYVDYEAMAYLDIKSSYNILKSINPHFEEEIGQDSTQIAQLILEGQKKIIPVDLNSIADLFCNNENLKFVLRKRIDGELPVFKLDSAVYIKDNKAYFSIYGNTWSETFLATYSNKKIELSFLYGEQE